MTVHRSQSKLFSAHRWIQTYRPQYPLLSNRNWKVDHPLPAKSISTTMISGTWPIPTYLFWNIDLWRTSHCPMSSSHRSKLCFFKLTTANSSVVQKTSPTHHRAISPRAIQRKSAPTFLERIQKVPSFSLTSVLPHLPTIPILELKHSSTRSGTVRRPLFSVTRTQMEVLPINSYLARR